MWLARDDRGVITKPEKDTLRGFKVRMFCGEYSHTIDAKGRLIIPARFRESLGERFMVTKGIEGCLRIYDDEGWKDLEEQLKNLPADQEGRQMARFLSAGVSEMEVDKQGRILIPANLREFAGLEKDVVFAGVIGYIEVWDKKKYEACTAHNNMEEIADSLSKRGFLHL